MSAELELNGKSVDEGGNEQPTDDGEYGQKPADGVGSHEDVTGNAEAVVKRRGRPPKKANATKESNGKIDRYFLRGKTEEEKAIFMSREKVPRSPAVKQRANDGKQNNDEDADNPSGEEGESGEEEEEETDERESNGSRTDDHDNSGLIRDLLNRTDTDNNNNNGGGIGENWREGIWTTEQQGSGVPGRKIDDQTLHIMKTLMVSIEDRLRVSWLLDLGAFQKQLKKQMEEQLEKAARPCRCEHADARTDSTDSTEWQKNCQKEQTERDNIEFEIEREKFRKELDYWKQRCARAEKRGKEREEDSTTNSNGYLNSSGRSIGEGSKGQREVSWKEPETTGHGDTTAEWARVGSNRGGGRTTQPSTMTSTPTHENSRRSSTASRTMVPSPMAKEELEWELKERRARKKNITVRGVRVVGKGIVQEVTEIIKTRMNIDPKIVRMQKVAGGPVFTIESMDKKKGIMMRKRELKGTKIWIDDDYTPREREIQDWIREEAARRERTGSIVRVGYLKLRIDGTWWNWNEVQGKLDKASFRNFRKRSNGII